MRRIYKETKDETYLETLKRYANSSDEKVAEYAESLLADLEGYLNHKTRKD